MFDPQPKAQAFQGPTSERSANAIACGFGSNEDTGACGWALNEDDRRNALAACTEATRRATQTLEWAISNNVDILTIALDHLTLARAALYRAILDAAQESHTNARRHQDEHSADSLRALVPARESLTEPATHLRHALDGFRKAGTLHELPKALLTSSLLAAVWHSGRTTAGPAPTGRPDSGDRYPNGRWEPAPMALPWL